MQPGTDSRNKRNRTSEAELLRFKYVRYTRRTAVVVAATCQISLASFNARLVFDLVHPIHFTESLLGLEDKRSSKTKKIKKPIKR